MRWRDCWPLASSQLRGKNGRGGWNVSQNQSWGCRTKIVQHNNNNYSFMFPSRSCREKKKKKYFKGTQPEKRKDRNREKIKSFTNGKLSHHETTKNVLFILIMIWGQIPQKQAKGSLPLSIAFFFFLRKFSITIYWKESLIAPERCKQNKYTGYLEDIVSFWTLSPLNWSRSSHHEFSLKQFYYSVTAIKV